MKVATLLTKIDGFVSFYDTSRKTIVCFYQRPGFPNSLAACDPALMDADVRIISCKGGALDVVCDYKK